MSCISTVTPVLNKTAGVDNWRVDLSASEKILSVPANVDANEIIDSLKKVGYEAEKI